MTRLKGSSPTGAAISYTCFWDLLMYSQQFGTIPRHIGFIPDGNRRWAEVADDSMSTCLSDMSCPEHLESRNVAGSPFRSGSGP